MRRPASAATARRSAGGRGDVGASVGPKRTGKAFGSINYPQPLTRLPEHGHARGVGEGTEEDTDDQDDHGRVGNEGEGGIGNFLLGMDGVDGMDGEIAAQHQGAVRGVGDDDDVDEMHSLDYFAAAHERGELGWTTDEEAGDGDAGGGDDGDVGALPGAVNHTLQQLSEHTRRSRRGNRENRSAFNGSDDDADEHQQHQHGVVDFHTGHEGHAIARSGSERGAQGHALPMRRHLSDSTQQLLGGGGGRQAVLDVAFLQQLHKHGLDVLEGERLVDSDDEDDGLEGSEAEHWL